MIVFLFFVIFLNIFNSHFSCFSFRSFSSFCSIIFLFLFLFFLSSFFRAPEVENKPAVVRLIQMPSRKELVSKNMFEVKHEVDKETGAVTQPGMKFYWQNAGEYLAVR